MPEQSHPPYVSGALTIPRQLERWLDVNPQNGPLRRTERFFTIPAFDFWALTQQITFPYNGVIKFPSVIVGVYNFTSPNIFSLKTVQTGMIPSSTSYTLVIASKNSNGSLTRYILQQAGTVIPVVLPVYTGQPINKTFRIEVWYPSTIATELTHNELIINTSVKGDIDYRYGVDQPLESMTSSVIGPATEPAFGVGPDPFGVTLPSNLPLTMPVNTYI